MLCLHRAPWPSLPLSLSIHHVHYKAHLKTPLFATFCMFLHTRDKESIWAETNQLVSSALCLNCSSGQSNSVPLSKNWFCERIPQIAADQLMDSLNLNISLKKELRNSLNDGSLPTQIYKIKLCLAWVELSQTFESTLNTYRLVMQIGTFCYPNSCKHWDTPK